MVERLGVSIRFMYLFIFKKLVCQGVKAPYKANTHIFFCTLVGEEHRAVPSRIGRAPQTNPLLNHIHDLSTQAPQIPAPTLWQAQRDL